MFGQINPPIGSITFGEAPLKGGVHECIAVRYDEPATAVKASLAAARASVEIDFTDEDAREEAGVPRKKNGKGVDGAWRLPRPRRDQAGSCKFMAWVKLS